MELTGLIKENAQQLILPYLVAIYNDEPVQIGTGFLVYKDGLPIFITAKHVLEGHNFDENPGEKFIFVDNKLQQLSTLDIGYIVKAVNDDICAISIKEFTQNDCLPISSLEFQTSNLKMLSILGFLARDFKRDSSVETLCPQPFIYTNKYYHYQEGYVGIQYDKRSTSSGVNGKVQPPIPRGLSGCPMFDTVKILQGRVSIAGVFTEERMSSGFVYGEHIGKMTPILDEVVSDRNSI